LSQSDSSFSAIDRRNSPTQILEDGGILQLPDFRFALSEAEQRFLSETWLGEGSKNISFDGTTGKLSGSSCQGADYEELKALIARFSADATRIIRTLCPEYREQLQTGRTSFRPAEIAGRTTSWRKDDTRLHVDAFPSRPIRGNRILRVFVNVNHTHPRIWRTGEPFEDVARRFVPQLRGPLPGQLPLLEVLHITKGRRSLYDHYMLGIHDAIKADTRYQVECPQLELSFPPGEAWACFTDSVSHAAMRGQHALEQTFYLPVTAMGDPALSPVRILESVVGKNLL